MSYIKSSNIEIFPSTRRADYQLSARLMSEARIAGIINQLVDKDGFVITSEDLYSIASPFEFNIKGYYFKVTDLPALFQNFSDSTSIYAQIRLQSNEGYMEIVGQDDAHLSVPDGTDGYYYGVNFLSLQPATEANSYFLKLFERASTSDSWSIVPSSWDKFNSTSLDFIVDGGKI